MDLTPTSEGRYRWEKPLPTGEKVLLVAKEVRKERTGLHANIGIGFEGAVLAHDTFNVGRNEDRGRLAKSAGEKLKRRSALAFEAYPAIDIKDDLDTFCLELGRLFDEQFTGDMLIPKRHTGSPYALRPFIVDGGGTIFFGPPKAGKSFLGLLMCQSIMYQVETFWPVRKQVVCYVNLERSKRSMENRLALVNDVMGLGDKGMPMVNARGQSLERVAQSVRATVQRYKATIIWIDSISRSGVGSLVHDDSANRLIDMASGLCETWGAIGHTPREDGSHSYGSVMFEAGQDVGVQVVSERRDNEVGLMLRMQGANDIPLAKPQFYALSFTGGEESALQGFRHARESEFPGFTLAQPSPPYDQIVAHLAIVGMATAFEVQRATGLPLGTINKVLGGPGFSLVKREGKLFYGNRVER